MATFIQQSPLWTGEFAFGAYFDGLASTPSTSGCPMTPPPYRISTDSPASRSNMIFQPVLNQVPEPSFFDEAVTISSMSTEATYGFPPPSPQYITGMRIPESAAKPRPILPAGEVDLKPSNNLRNRKSLQEKTGAPSAGISRMTTGILKTRRRGRKPRGQLKEFTNPPQKDDIDDDEDDDDDDEVNIPKDPRRRKILERNRIAATKCRLRKRDEASALASQEQAMEDRNRYLSATFDSLTTEIYHLKTQLLRHTDCGCVLIQKYIANEARKSVDGLACTPTFRPDLIPLGYHRGSSGSGTSVTDSYGHPTPKTEKTSPAWTVPFQADSNSPEVGADIVDMGLEPFAKEHMIDPCQQIPCTSSIDGCGPGILASMGQQLQVSDGGIWNQYW